MRQSDLEGKGHVVSARNKDDKPAKKGDVFDQKSRGRYTSSELTKYRVEKEKSVPLFPYQR